MAQIQSVHSAYRPFQAATPAPVVYPTTTYPAPYPTSGYPATVPSSVDTTSFSGVGNYIAAGIAGLKSGDTIKRAASSYRRSRAGYGGYRASGYRSNSYRSSHAGAGMTGRAGSQFMGAVKSSFIWGSIISVALNTYNVMQNRITFAQAGGNVTGDVMSSVIGGVGAAALSTVGSALLGGMLGTGLMMSAASIGLGLVGFMVADGIFRKTSFFQKTTTAVQTMLT